GRDDGRMQALLALAASADASVSRLPRAKLDELVAGRHQGVVAELKHSNPGQNDLRWGEAQLEQAVTGNPRALVLVLDGVTDPHNLGACMRSADAAGVTAVVVPKDNAADITAVVRKVACGATETVPLVRVTNLARSLDMLKAAGVWIYGTAGEVGESLYATKLNGPVALVMGAEGEGMRRLTRERCDFLVSLPMAGSVSSLNVSVATGVCLFEIRRQRLLADTALGM
ncbi:MAG: 23S rRNA (guanosine(2251)-2'-O)-methyltransferase RlmB, partial [Congregibacter sp.]|nr:23S rRNA (guanosine(2251)-2'-O)-methyltransferase RlmB [Congregibacter sp.]